MRLRTVNAGNLNRIAGLNGKTLGDLAEAMQCSKSLLYRAVHHPKKYPKRFRQINDLLPIRTVPNFPGHD